MTEQKKLRQGTNEVKLVGLVYDKSKLEVKQFDDKKNVGKKYWAVTGDIAIKVNDAIHYANVFQREFNEKDGVKTENRQFKAWKTVIDEYKTVMVDGEEEADVVALNNAQRALNEYGSPTGELVSSDRIRAQYITRLDKSKDWTPEATFIQELYVVSQRKETKKDDDGEFFETGNLILTGYTPDYQGNVVPFDIYVEGDDKVSYVEDNYVNGVTVKVHGNIIQKKFTTTKEVKATGFGKPKIETYTRYQTLYSVEGGNDPEDYHDADDTEVAETLRKFDTELFKEAIENRKKVIDAMIENAKNGGNNNNKPKQDTKKGGFGTKAPVNSQAASGLDIDSSDLPF